MKKICGSANVCADEDCNHRVIHEETPGCTMRSEHCPKCVAIPVCKEKQDLNDLLPDGHPWKRACHRAPTLPNKETDPNGIPANEPGAKLDAGKVRVGMMLDQFAHALWAVAEVSTYGAGKYSEGGWLEVPDGEARYSDAEGRHRLKKGMGEEYDAESGLLHDAHKAWNTLARLELKLRKDPSHKETTRQKVTKMLLGLGLKPENYLISIEEEEKLKEKK